MILENISPNETIDLYSITGEIQKETFASCYTFFVFIIENLRMNYLITFFYYIHIFVDMCTTSVNK